MQLPVSKDTFKFVSHGNLHMFMQAMGELIIFTNLFMKFITKLLNY